MFAGEEAREKVGEWPGDGVGDDDAEEGGECEEADCVAGKEVGGWGEELGSLRGDEDNTWGC